MKANHEIFRGRLVKLVLVAAVSWSVGVLVTIAMAVAGDHLHEAGAMVLYETMAILLGLPLLYLLCVCLEKLLGAPRLPALFALCSAAIPIAIVYWVVPGFRRFSPEFTYFAIPVGSVGLTFGWGYSRVMQDQWMTLLPPGLSRLVWVGLRAWALGIISYYAPLLLRSLWGLSFDPLVGLTLSTVAVLFFIPVLCLPALNLLARSFGHKSFLLLTLTPALILLLAGIIGLPGPEIFREWRPESVPILLMYVVIGSVFGHGYARTQLGASQSPEPSPEAAS